METKTIYILTYTDPDSREDIIASAHTTKADATNARLALSENGIPLPLSDIIETELE